MSGSCWKMFIESAHVNASMPWCLKRFREAALAFVISQPQHNHTSATGLQKITGSACDNFIMLRLQSPDLRAYSGYINTYTVYIYIHWLHTDTYMYTVQVIEVYRCTISIKYVYIYIYFVYLIINVCTSKTCLVLQPCPCLPYVNKRIAPPWLPDIGVGHLRTLIVTD